MAGLLGAAALAMGACRGGDVPDVAATPTPAVTAEESPLVASTPSPSPSPTVPAELAELRASDRFLELAEHERAQGATWARFGWEAFAPFADGEKLFEWANKAELWDAVAPPFRDECLLAGPEATRPMWDAEVLIPAGIEPRWSNESTGGRGQFVELICVYHDEVADEPAERWGAVLISSDESRAGDVVAEMPPFEVYEDDHPNFASRREWVRDHLWEWIGTQEVRHQ